MVMLEAGRVVGIGALMGMLAARGLTKLLASMLFGVSAQDPLTFGGVALLIGVVAAVASFVPAMRAARVDPLRAIRAQ